MGEPVIGFLLRRALAALPVLVAVSLITFGLLYLAPSPLAELQETAGYSAQEAAAVAEENGWNDPWFEQYGRWVGGLLMGDMGTSVATGEPAADIIGERLPLTLLLAGSALLFSLAIALPLGTWTALRRDGRADTASTLVAVGLMAMPGFVLAFLLQLFALGLRDLTGGIVFYAGGAPLTGGVLETIQRLALPTMTLAAMQVAVWVRFQRASTLTVLGEEFMRTAYAKGLSERAIILRHAARNTMLPLLTLLALDVAALLGGSVIVETIFGLPGLGRLLVESVQAKDTVVALNIVALGAFAMVVCNLVADVLYGVADPRTRNRERT